MQFLIATSFVIIFGFGLNRSQAEAEHYPRVVTPLGTIEGFYNTSSEGQLHESYLGIPYASPPTGKWRFRIAKPIAPWSGVLMAKQFSSPCMQVRAVFFDPLRFQMNGSEDCLYLNIYTPAANRNGRKKTSADLLPVIFFIHGGAFQIGTAAAFGPKYLLNNNVVLVTINYRLGLLGFMSTEDDIVPGNMGLKDQVIAMRWVKDNVAYFGGDPERITLVGQSAGAASVHFHYLTNVSAGLFQRGMSLSGSAFNCWAQTENSLEKAKELATIVGCPSSNVLSMVECLRKRPADEITFATRHFIVWLDNPYVAFGPVVEKGWSEFTFIDRLPIETIISGRVLSKPWITTTVSEEGLATAATFVDNAKLLKELDDNWLDIAPHLFDYNYTVPDSEKIKIARLIRQHYVGTEPFDNSTIKQIIRMTGDRLFHYDVEKVARLQARFTRSPVRFYYFSYRGAYSLSERYTGAGKNFGVSHMDDVPYVLDTLFDSTTTQRDREMQKIMTNLWVSYATDGIPDVGVEWPELDPDLAEFKYLHIIGPDDIHMDGNLNLGDKNFWQSIPFRENIIP